MPARIGRRPYWMALIGWFAAFWLVDKASDHLPGAADLMLLAVWALAGAPLMCARLADAAAPWALGLIPVPLAIACLALSGAVYREQGRNLEMAERAAWTGPALFALVGLALFALLVAPVVIGLLPPARPAPPAPGA